MLTRTRWVWIAALVVIGAGLAAYLAARGPSAIEVDVAAPTRHALFRSTVTASGEIVATRYADIGSSVMGRIVSLPVREGEAVRAGQVLARIDAVQAQSSATGAGAQVGALEAEERAAAGQVKAATADLAATEARADDTTRQARRLADLFKDGLVGAAEYETARATAAAAEAQVASTRAAIEAAKQAQTAASRRIGQARAQQTSADDTLAKTAIVSPIRGIVSRLRVREGEMVVIGIQNQPGTTLMTVSDLSQIDLEVRVAEADVLRLAIRQSATVILEALPGQNFPGTLVEIGASALPVTGVSAAAREFKAVVRLTDVAPGFRPGLSGDAEIVTSERSNVQTVPLQSVVLRPASGGVDRAGVFVVSNGRAVFTPVTPGVIGGLNIEVTGVGETDRVIVGPYQVLRELVDGAVVTVAARKN